METLWFAIPADFRDQSMSVTGTSDSMHHITLRSVRAHTDLITPAVLLDPRAFAHNVALRPWRITSART